MKIFSEGYLAFERKHLEQLECLWRETQNKDLRQLILMTRETLECIYDGDATVSTWQVGK